MPSDPMAGRRLIRRKQSKDFESAVIDWMERIEERIDGIPQSNGNAGRLAALYGTTPHPRIDGQVTFADCVESLMMMGVFFAGSVVMGMGTLVLTGRTDVATDIGGLTVSSGAVFALGRLAADATLPRVADLWAFIQARQSGEWQEFCDQQRTDHAESQEISHRATIEVREGRTSHYLGLEDDELEQAIQFARAYLAMGEDAMTAEAAWVGRDKLWPGGQAGRQAFSEWRDWCIHHGLAWVVDGRGKWEFKERGKRVLRELAEMEIAPHPVNH